MIRRLVISAILVISPAAYADDACSNLTFDDRPSEACIQLMDLIMRVAERIEVCLKPTVDPESEAWWAYFRACETAAHQAECRLDRCFPGPKLTR